MANRWFTIMHCCCVFTEDYIDWWSSLTNDWTYGMLFNLTSFLFDIRVTCFNYLVFV